MTKPTDLERANYRVHYYSKLVAEIIPSILEKGATLTTTEGDTYTIYRNNSSAGSHSQRPLQHAFEKMAIQYEAELVKAIKSQVQARAAQTKLEVVQ